MSVRGNYLPGDRVGRLTVNGISHRDYNGNIIWSLTCDCGRPTRYKTRDLRYRQFTAACRGCRRAWTALKSTKALRELWKNHGTLYGESAQCRIDHDVRAALVAEFGPVDDRVRLPVEVVDACESDDEGEGQPVVSPDDGMAMTLKEIGDELGMTRENVRLIEVRALRKLRTAFDALLTQGGGADSVIADFVLAARAQEAKAAATRAEGLAQRAKKAARLAARARDESQQGRLRRIAPQVTS